MKVEGVRGMADILPDETPIWQGVEEKLREVFSLYDYREIRTPLVERADLFSRTVGEATDIVHKEMYTFSDKKGQLLALRPEATASVVRAYIEHGLYATGDVQKLYYLGPMFRYEKPQRGRSRQFHQYGVEALGSLSPALDVEVIDLAWHLMKWIGVPEEGLFLRLNSIGCREDRPAYREALRKHFSLHALDLCPDCQRRLSENPLRILDCKNEKCQPLIAAAPQSLNYLCPDCRRHFAELQSYVHDLGLPYELDHTLVRGIDYYTRTVFELCSRELGAQDALLGGGRYDDLVELLGGPPTPGVGFAGGLERLVLLVKGTAAGKTGARIDERMAIYLLPIGEERRATKILARLRRAGVRADMDYMGRSLRKRLQVAAQSGARYAAFLGPEEAAKASVKLRDLVTGEERLIPEDELVRSPEFFAGKGKAARGIIGFPSEI